MLWPWADLSISIASLHPVVIWGLVTLLAIRKSNYYDMSTLSLAQVIVNQSNNGPLMRIVEIFAYCL